MGKRKCKECGEKFEPKYSSVQMVCSPLCAIAYQKKKEKQAWQKRKKKMKAELETLPDLLKKAQDAFNFYIRERDKGRECISCDVRLTGKFKYDAGHYYAAGNYSGLRFDEMNVHGQCVACNQHKHGNLQEYGNRLLYRVAQLIIDGHGHGPYSVVKTQKLTDQVEVPRKFADTYAEKVCKNLHSQRHDLLELSRDKLKDLAKEYRAKARQLK